ncbi:hypothetical protein BJ944DRAFT_77828 [Cunninghamella echinulata]|nr:hypothetical protein BJ944DRAFT_77828 [Cunninghamella echinulata]
MDKTNMDSPSLLNKNKQIDSSLFKENSQLQQILLLALSTINAQNNNNNASTKNDNDKRTFDQLELNNITSTSSAVDSPVDHGSPNSDTSASEKLSSNKPGRKPLTEEEIKNSETDPKFRRKAQNRAAQRAFRERRVNYVKELEDRIKILEEEKNQTSSSEKLEQENRELKKIIQQLQLENAILGGAAPSFDVPLSKLSESSSNIMDRPQKLLRSTHNHTYYSNTNTSSTPSPESISFEIANNNGNTTNDLFNIPSSSSALLDHSSSSSALLTSDLLKNESLSLPSDVLSNFDPNHLLNQITLDSNSPFSVTSSSTATTTKTSASTLPTDILLPSSTSSLPTDILLPSPSSLITPHEIEKPTDFTTQQHETNDILDSLLVIDDDSDAKSSTSSSFYINSHDNHNNHNNSKNQRLSITKAWDIVTSHPRFDEFDIDFLCTEMRTKAVCDDSHQCPTEIMDKLEQIYPVTKNKN